MRRVARSVPSWHAKQRRRTGGCNERGCERGGAAQPSKWVCVKKTAPLFFQTRDAADRSMSISGPMVWSHGLPVLLVGADGCQLAVGALLLNRQQPWPRAVVKTGGCAGARWWWCGGAVRLGVGFCRREGEGKIDRRHCGRGPWQGCIGNLGTQPIGSGLAPPGCMSICDCMRPMWVRMGVGVSASASASAGAGATWGPTKAPAHR